MSLCRLLLIAFVLAGSTLPAAAPPAPVPPSGQFGRLVTEVTFPSGKIGRREPLVTSAGGQDILYVWYSGENEIRIGFHHLGAGGPVSAPVKISPGQPHTLELNLGCFYPPADDPAFAGWPAARVISQRRRLTVALDRQILLSTEADFHSTRPDQIQIGTNPGPYVTRGAFSGTLTGARHLGVPSLAGPPVPPGSGPLRLIVRFPQAPALPTEPLVSTGRAQSGELLYVTYVEPGRLRFGHDSWNGGAIQSKVLAYEPDLAQTVELEMPDLSPADPAPSGRFVLRYNGVVVLADNRPRHHSDPATVKLAVNANDSTVAGAAFSGEIDRVERIGPLTMTADAFQRGTGAARLVLRFPKAVGRYEPLLVTGHAGAGDVIFVHYVDDSHVRIGYDHWSHGGPLSEPIPVDYAAVHTVEIQLGSLLPPADDSRWAGWRAEARAAATATVQVKLDGTVALQHPMKAYPSAPAEIQVGVNSIGATTCEPDFTGAILLRERLGLPAGPP